MDSENNILTEKELLPETEPLTRAAYVSSVSIIEDGENGSVRIIVVRDLSDTLKSFTVAYRFSCVGKDGELTDSRFFSLVYDREALNTKDTISIRFSVPDGYNAARCTAYVSGIIHADGSFEKYSFGDGDEHAVSCFADGLKPAKLNRGKKKLARGAERIVAVAGALACAALLVFGIRAITDYTGVKKVVNGLIREGRYGEAYMIADECGSQALSRVTCSNIITKTLGEHDYETAYVFSTLNGKQNTVFRRVEYEIVNSDTSIIEGRAMAVLNKLENDSEYDRTLKEYIEKACAAGKYPEAIAAADALRSETDGALMHRNLIVDGVCRYSADSERGGMAKYDRALEFFSYYRSGDTEYDTALALEIVNRCISESDLAGAIVLSYCFADTFGEFEIDPAGITVSPHNPSIAHSLDCAYLILSDEQKRAYHAETLAISEEVRIVNNGEITGTDVKDALSAASYENRTAVLHGDGSVTHISNGGHNTVCDIPKDINAVQIAVGLTHTVVLKADGTVSAYGTDTCGQGMVGTWRDIVEVAAGRNFTVGLKSDGTLVACGSDKCGQCDVSGYSNVISVAACDQTTVILFSDGTVALCGDRAMGLGKACTFTNVEQIKAGGCTVIVKKTDGTFDMADGCINASSGDVGGWTASEISDYAVGSQCAAYTDTKGHLTLMGDGAPKTPH